MEILLKQKESGTIIFPMPQDNMMIISIDTIPPQKLSISNETVMKLMPEARLEITDKGIPYLEKLKTDMKEAELKAQEEERRAWTTMTPNQQLLAAYKKNDIGKMKKAFENGADPNTESGMAIFYNAIKRNKLDVFELLVEYKIRLNNQDEHGITPLMLATERAVETQSGYPENYIIGVLIDGIKKLNESLDLYDDKDRTAYWIAREGKRPDIAKLLLDKGANPWLSPAEIKKMKRAKLTEWEIENEQERKKRNVILIEQGKPEEQSHISENLLDLIGHYNE